jgi:hypothetical protein
MPRRPLDGNARRAIVNANHLDSRGVEKVPGGAFLNWTGAGIGLISLAATRIVQGRIAVWRKRRGPR